MPYKELAYCLLIFSSHKAFDYQLLSVSHGNLVEIWVRIGKID
jgi:hypothetical protein